MLLITNKLMEGIMSESVVVDGSLSLAEQNQTLNYYQQQKGCKVANYEKDLTAANPQNIATSEKLPLGTNVPYLQLVAIAKDDSDVKPSGTTLTFDNIVYVNSKSTQVAGFHES
jgi:hypothetical protein